MLAEDRIKIFQTKRTKPEVGLDLTIRNNSGDTKLKRQIRMFPNKPEIRYEFPVDESVTESHRRAGILIKTSDITIQHNKKISTDDVDEKQNYYRYLREEWLKRHEEVGMRTFIMGACSILREITQRPSFIFLK